MPSVLASLLRLALLGEFTVPTCPPLSLSLSFVLVFSFSRLASFRYNFFPDILPLKWIFFQFFHFASSENCFVLLSLFLFPGRFFLFPFPLLFSTPWTRSATAIV